MTERFKVGEFKTKQRTSFRRDKDNPFSLSKMPTKDEVEDFLKGMFYSSDTIYNANRGRFEKKKKT